MFSNNTTFFSSYVLAFIIVLPLIMALRSMWMRRAKEACLYGALTLFGFHITLAALAENGWKTSYIKSSVFAVF